MNFPSQIFFNDINHGYRAAILKKNPLWLLAFYMSVATYFYHEKVRRTMRTAIVLYLLSIVTRKKNIAWKFARGYCLYNCKTFLLVPHRTECTKKIFAEECSTLLLKYHNIIGQRRTTDIEKQLTIFFT